MKCRCRTMYTMATGMATSTAAAATLVGSPARSAPAKKLSASGAVCLSGAAAHQHQREQELVPRVGEHQGAQGQQRRPRLGQQHLGQDAEGAGAVHPRRLGQRARRGQEVGAHPERAERDRLADLRQDQRPVGVEQAGPLEVVVERDDRRLEREHDAQQHQVEHQPVAAEAHRPEGVAGADRERRRDRGDRGRDDQARPEPGGEVGLVPGGAEAVQLGIGREREAGDEVVPRVQRQRQDRERGVEGADRERQQHAVGDDPIDAAGGHRRSPPPSRMTSSATARIALPGARRSPRRSRPGCRRTRSGRRRATARTSACRGRPGSCCR